jgi:hypothetical protein
MKITRIYVTDTNGPSKIKSALNKFVKEKISVEIRCGSHKCDRDYHICVTGILSRTKSSHYTVRGVRRKHDDEYIIKTDSLHLSFRKCEVISNTYGQWQIWV